MGKSTIRPTLATFFPFTTQEFSMVCSYTEIPPKTTKLSSKGEALARG